MALRFHDPAKLALTLIALDGVAASLFLVSSDLPPGGALPKLIDDFRPDLIISDEPGAAEEVPQLRWTDELLAREHGIGYNSETEWVLATSGTTGSPKLVAHSLRSLMRTTKVGNERKLRWGQLYDLCRFAGVQVFLQGLLGGRVLLLPAQSASLDSRLRFLRDSQCEALSATPTLWRKVLMTSGMDDWPLKQITLGGEIADASILNALKARFPEARIAHVYASTEAGVGFSVSDGLPGFPLSYLEDGCMTIVEDRLFIATVGGTYLNYSQPIRDLNGFIDTGDVVQVVDERCIFLGRANGAINVGGNKLFPEEVETILLELDEIHAARVFAKPSPITGQIVVAELVVSDAQIEPKAIRKLALDHCASRLERWKIPAMIQIKASLENSASGKLDRKTA
ncbi:AMP-binding protein [Rhizobium sullae]|uniref:AMP-binding protein n=1 Tax=Rhizobium sullae TaxID=50338 RepID=UPI0018E1E1EB|nr:class I adenylate-forming enzyme family protein [Rhizobium sullae]